MNENERIRAQQKDIKLFAKTLKDFVYSNLKSILADIESGRAKGIQAAAILGALETKLKALGLEKLLAEVQKIYADDLKAVKAGLQKLSGKEAVIFSDVDKPMIEALIKGGYDQASKLTEKYLGDIRQQVASRVLTGSDVNFDQAHGQLGPRLESQIETEVNTSVAMFNRSVTISKAEELGFTLFEYLGPDDQITRPFCYKLLERDPAIYSIDEILSMPDQQGLPVISAGGGYNCRHQWRPISEESAREAGWAP